MSVDGEFSSSVPDIPQIRGWQVVVDLHELKCCKNIIWLVQLWSHQKLTSKHKLRINIIAILVISVLVPHCPHDGFSSLSMLVESSVDVMNEVISFLNCTSQCPKYSR